VPEAGFAGRSILVVDDEDVFARSLAEGLQAELPGVDVHIAHDGHSALEILEHRVVDLVVTDVNMPGMDGLALVAAMVSRRIRIPVIMVTAFGNRKVELEARRHGVISVIDKPIDFSFMVEVCRNTLCSLGQGALGGITLAGLLQLLEMEQRSCTVRVFAHGRAGQICIDRGRVVRSTQAAHRGVEALQRILRWDEPAIELGPLRAVEAEAEPMSLQAALLEAARVDDEIQRDEELVFEAEPSTPHESSNPQHRDHDRVKEEQTMANIEQAITSAMSIQGCIAVALVDYESGMCLGSKANGFPIEVAAAGNTEVLRAKLRVMADLGIEGRISDVLITLDTQYHLLLPLRQGTLFLYMAIDRRTGNLAMARHKLTAVEKDLVV